MPRHSNAPSPASATNFSRHSPMRRCRRVDPLRPREIEEELVQGLTALPAVRERWSVFLAEVRRWHASMEGIRPFRTCLGNYEPLVARLDLVGASCARVSETSDATKKRANIIVARLLRSSDVDKQHLQVTIHLAPIACCHVLEILR